MSASGLAQKHMQRREAPIGNGAVAAYNGVRAMEDRGEAIKRRSVGFWSSQPPSDLTPFMPAEVKDTIAEYQEVFTVLRARLRGTQHGDTWLVDVEYQGQGWTIAFSALPFRQEQMEALQGALREGPIDATLRAFDSDAGHGWALAEPPGYNADGVLPDRTDTDAASPPAEDESPF